MIKPFFEREYYLRTSDFDRYKRLSPASVLDLFQDAAGCHAELLGCGGDAMLARDLVWVVVKIKYRVIAQPEMHERVKVRTWPLPAKKVSFRREYRIEGADGRVLVLGASEWALMSASQRKLAVASDVYPPMEHITEQSFEGRLGRVKDFAHGGEACAVRPGFSYIDMNGHVNNTRYATFVMDALNPDGEKAVEELQIDYHREVMEGAPLSVFTHREDDEILAKGLNESGENMFSCRISLK